MSDFAIFCLCATGAYIVRLFFNALKEPGEYAARIEALEAAVFQGEEEPDDGGPDGGEEIEEPEPVEDAQPVLQVIRGGKEGA